MLPAVRLTDLLAAAGVFGGRVPPSPPQGRYRHPMVPDAVERRLATSSALAAWVRDPLARDADGPVVGSPVPLLLPPTLAQSQSQSSSRSSPRRADGYGSSRKDELSGSFRSRRPTGGVGPRGGAGLGGGVAARQVSPTTCGAAVLVLLRCAGDPTAALEIATAPRPADAFGAAQRETHRAATRTVGSLPGWPRSWGTPPWGAAREARYGPVRYTHRVVGSHRRAAETVAAAVRAAAAGVPVPLYTSGDLGTGPATAVPRHVVLLTDVTDGVARLYEPSSGSLHALPVELLDDPAPADRVLQAARTRALGGWPHVVWTLLPRGQSGTDAP